MTFGSPRLLRLPGSGSLVWIVTIASGNTCGATYWTDGRRIAPMLPDVPPLRVHPRTRELFWVEECEDLTNDTDPGGVDVGELPFAEDPEAADWLRAIETGLAKSPEDGRAFLVWFWWLANDHVRKTGKLALDRDTFNFQVGRVIEWSDLEMPNSRLMAAEAARETGQSAVANDLLRFPWPVEYELAAERIRSLTNDGDIQVRELVSK